MKISPMPPLVKIRSERDHMSAIERRIADFILDNAHLLRDYSSQQLASALGISQSSVVKFSQKFGFRGYPDLKYSVGQAVARTGADAPARDAPARWGSSPNKLACICSIVSGSLTGQSARADRIARPAMIASATNVIGIPASAPSQPAMG